MFVASTYLVNTHWLATGLSRGISKVQDSELHAAAFVGPKLWILWSGYLYRFSQAICYKCVYMWLLGCSCRFPDQVGWFLLVRLVDWVLYFSYSTCKYCCTWLDAPGKLIAVSLGDLVKIIAMHHRNDLWWPLANISSVCMFTGFSGCGILLL